MNIDKIIESATAICTLRFQKAIKEEARRLESEENTLAVWALPRAIENKTPELVADMLRLVLSEVLVSVNPK